MKVIIVGGVAGGATAATRARRLNEEAEIVLFERGFYVSYANCGLPYYIGGQIEKRDDLFISSPERLRARYRIDVRTSQEVIEIHPKRKQVTVKDNTSGEIFEESYDKIILSPGATPIRPPLEGINLDRIFTLRDLPDSDSIKAYLKENDVGSAVVIGGGPIGLETAENLKVQGVAVTVIERLNQLMPPLDFEMAAIVHRQLRDKGISLYLGDGIESFDMVDGRIIATTKKGKELVTDMVVLAIGVKPEKHLAEKAGLAIGQKDGISVDTMLSTSDSDIYAIGDAIEVENHILGEKVLTPLAGPANRQGRISADNAMGRKSQFSTILGTNITQIFGLVAASTGCNEKILREHKIPFLRSFTHSFDHATYYPGAKLLSIKLLFAPDKGGILGAQVVGEQGVDKRIDILATAMKAGMSVYDLENLELAYSPQYGAAKDPVNIAGFVAANILKGDVEVVHWDELEELDMDTHQLLDVRTPEEVKQTGMIKNGINIYIDSLRENLEMLDRNRTYITYCTVSLRGYIAYRILVQNGFKAKILSGGLETWTPLQEDMAERST
jgi:NADPH-dependent 2,4-dienoyl-CoA reductase/sulfur reductase-like enzyme/rhodanese-related sulfurtransferase